MSSLGDELSLGSMPITINGFQIKVSKVMNVVEHIKKLEEEKRKIQDHKLELPLSLEILNNAISCLKEETKICLVNENTKPLLKDFISLNKPIQEEELEKKFQLWKNNDHTSRLEIERNEEKASMLLIPSMRNPKVETGLGLGLTSSAVDSGSRKDIVSSSFTSMPQPPAFLQKQALRKQRRCWTPELHRRFVDALQQLGGPGVATPKQIREHMQEEGLTNDEVKSHLQKYRLHIRRPSSTPEKQSVVVLGFKLWNSSQEEDGEGESSKRSDSQSDSPQGPLQLPSTTTTTTCGDSSMEDGEDTKSESFKMDRD